ncbi:MAG TPA: carboxylating nicotinate-nucleotide diphosphorylase [Balneolales bacterium]|nr:carboxylating nicotinate-nucleotide diphosphorylase [Balneolales bacterium]
MNEEITFIVERALKEDIGNGDITTEAIYSGNERAHGRFIAKQQGVIAGLELVEYIFSQLTDDIKLSLIFNDGDAVDKGDVIAEIEGSSGRILTGERTALNFMQRMSGIASKTRMYVDAVSHTSAKILDTRKTVPGHRYLDKWAVRLGGGQNHRMRLDDRFLIKENHITVAGSVSNAIQACLDFKARRLIKADIEIEVQDLKQLDEVLDYGGVKYILLDNMTTDDMKKAVEKVDGSVLLEASGNVTLQTVTSIAETGVDFISVGALTHSVEALDISLIFD